MVLSLPCLGHHCRLAYHDVFTEPQPTNIGIHRCMDCGRFGFFIATVMIAVICAITESEKLEASIIHASLCIKKIWVGV